MNDLEIKRNRIEKTVKILSLLVVGFLVAPFVFIAIKGLVGLAVAGAISLVVVNLIPWFSAMVANWRLKALKHEAAKNPIETLQNDYRKRIEALQAFRQSILNSKAEVYSFRDKLDGFKKQYPADAAKFDEQYRQMLALLKLRGQKYEEAKGNLERYDGEITRAKAIWDMAQAAAAMNKAAGVDADEFYAKIQVETALDSVQKNLNLAFADLEMSLVDEKSSAGANAVPVQPVVETPKALEGGKASLDLDIEVGEPTPHTRKL
jgi:predicted RNase H-like nuclease (RuvC/YqgF family)